MLTEFNPYDPPASIDDGFEAPGDADEPAGFNVKSVPVILTIIFSVFTGGIYMRVWFLTRARALNALRAPDVLVPAIFVVCIILDGLSFGVVLASGVFEGLAEELAKPDYLAIAQTLDNIDRFETIVVGIIILVQCFKVKRILQHYVYRQAVDGIGFSGVATFFLGIFYLQYKINRLNELAP
jgi:hypothetical protein